ncbi:THO complex subunit 3 [Mayamaea pseudoterrestris]|nr:THO complex subunit 3 [Mayamaea pseudoterrestris]
MREPTTPLSIKSCSIVDCGPHRVSSRSVSWSVSGSYLSMAGSDATVRVLGVDAGGAAAREVLVVSGHSAAATKTRFHPIDESVLCTAANDKTVRLWDVRNASQRATGIIDVKHGNSPVSVEWSRQSMQLVVVEQDGSVCVYDARKLSAGDRGSGKGSQPQHLFRLPKRNVTEMCIFSPDGNYLIAEACSDYVGSLQIWPLQGDKDANNVPTNVTSFPTHGPIYSMQFSPSNTKLATGGADACVSVWDTDSMACLYTIARPTKYVRSVSFSHDSKLLATSANADCIDISDASNGALVGMVTATGTGWKLGVLEEVAWHPKEYVIACARLDAGAAGMSPSPIALVKLEVGQAGLASQ